eukprot:1557163-Amphidinium_carterae.1
MTPVMLSQYKMAAACYIPGVFSFASVLFLTTKVTKWILDEISTCSLSGKMLIEAPILTRVYHELSNGMLAFFRAMQIEAVPFPFPFAQVINYACALAIPVAPEE